MVRWSIALTVMAACTHAARPTVSGAELYAQVHTLQATGQATIGAVAVRKTQVLATDEQAFVVEQAIDRCRGGDPAADVDCTLALLLDRRFIVLDRMPRPHDATAKHEDQSRSIATSTVVVGLGLAAAGGLVYGVATCDFPGCRAVFGLPLVFVAGGALVLLAR